MSAKDSFVRRCVPRPDTEAMPTGILSVCASFDSANGLGFTLREIHELLQLHRDLSEFDGKTVMKAAAVREIVAMANERLAMTDEKLTTLTAMRGDAQRKRWAEQKAANK